MKKSTLVALLSVTLFSISNLSPVIAHADAVIDNSSSVTSETTFDGQYYSIKQNGQTIVIQDKKTSETVTMNLINHNEATTKNSNGEQHTLTKDDSGNIYQDGKLVQSLQTEIDLDTKNKSNEALQNASLARSGTYHYLQTTYSSTKIDGDLQSIALGIFSFVPYVGWIGTIASLVETFKNMGKPVMYTKTDEYYIDGYSRYKYVTYYYSDSGRTNLVKTSTLYKDMW